MGRISRRPASALRRRREPARWIHNVHSQHSEAAVPEPTVLTLLGVSLLGLAGAAWSRR
ncbi:MAG: hypothetical protein DMD99_09340 [Candidatus Rokuibacteriota bacterium]|nr:MAG: hypothetical protein DMD99_09340 [Candidatus Rokubacteria bacterium]